MWCFLISKIFQDSKNLKSALEALQASAHEVKNHSKNQSLTSKTFQIKLIQDKKVAYL